MMQPHKNWTEWCEAADNIEDEFGTDKALTYLIGEKFLNFLQAAEYRPNLQAEIPAFVAEIKKIFEPWQLRECLERVRETELFDPDVFEDADPEIIEMERKADIRRCAADLLLVERAKEWLLEDGGEYGDG